MADTAEVADPQDLSFLDGTHQTIDGEEYLRMWGDRWKINNSSLEDYSDRARLFGDPDGLTRFIPGRVGYSEDNVGLDVAAGASARALLDLLNSGVIGQALATNYKDRRTKKVAADPRLDHIAGDLTRAATWRRILGWQAEHAPDGFAIVMHRPVGGLQDLLPDTYHRAAHLMLEMVRPGGMMFAQVPRPLMDAKDPADLNRLGRSIQERADVEEVITARRLPIPRRNRDLADVYAVILKQ